MKVVRDFLDGSLYVFRGIRFFYRTPVLWKYSLIPFLFLLLFYALILYAVCRFALPFLLDFLPQTENAPQLLRIFIRILRWIVALSCGIGVLLIALVTLTSGYELAGALFFDAMIVRIEQIRYHRNAEGLSFRKNLVCALQSALFSIRTVMLSLLLLIPALLIPVVGIVPMVLIIGYRQALTYLFSSGFNRGLLLPEIRRLAGKQKMKILGFGITINLLYLIPFAVIFLSPGFLAAGAMLYNETLAENRIGNPSQKDPDSRTISAE